MEQYKKAVKQYTKRLEKEEEALKKAQATLIKLTTEAEQATQTVTELQEKRQQWEFLENKHIVFFSVNKE